MNFKFKNYDHDNARAYFKHDGLIYCVMPGVFGVVLYTCSKDGEPSCPLSNRDEHYLEGFDSARWLWEDLRIYFEGLTRCGDIMRRMNELFNVVKP